MSETTGEALALQSVDGFTRALGPHLAVVAAVARRFSPADEADDVAQEAMLAAWRYRAGFEPSRGTFRAWLLTIVLTESRKAMAGRNRRQVLTMKIVQQEDGEPSVTPDLFGTQAIFEDVEAAIARLSSRQREVIGFYYFVDLPVDEVAAILGLSSGTVKSTLADARERIRQALRTKG
jgi:RNA polymerase sigma factor (sigma-70 family)